WGGFSRRLCQRLRIPTGCKKYLTYGDADVTLTLHLVVMGLHHGDTSLGFPVLAAGRGVRAVAVAGGTVEAARHRHRPGRDCVADHGRMGVAAGDPAHAARRARARGLAR